MTRVYWIITLLLIAGTVGVSAWLYPSLPQQIPTHWNIKGEIDGYGNKDWALFLLPAMMVPLTLLFYFLPALSPKHFEVDSFRSTYLYIMVLVTAMFAYLHGMILYAVWKSTQHAGTFDLTRPLIAGMFLFFALLGNVMGKIRKNFYIGDPGALDPGQRPGVERHASPGGLGDGHLGAGRIRADSQRIVADTRAGRVHRLDVYPDGLLVLSLQGA